MRVAKKLATAATGGGCAALRSRGLSTATTMDAAYMHGAYDVRMGKKARPGAAELLAGQVLVDVEAVGICGSDLHYYKDGGIGAAKIDPAAPFVPGHEFSAVLREDDEQLRLSAGARLAVDPARACGRCEWCRRAHENLCPHVSFTGAPPLDGALTETIPIGREQLFPVPQHFSAVQTLMLEPLGVAIHAVDLAAPRLLESVAIIGCGPVGLKIAQLCRLAGVGQVFALDPLPYRAAAAAAQANGADRSGTSLQELHDWTGGRGADLVIEATNSPRGFNDAAEAACIGGRVVLVGIPDGNDYAELDASLVRRKGLCIKLSRRMGHVMPRAIKLVDEGKVDVVSMVTHEFPLAEAPTAFARQESKEGEPLKSVILI